MSSAGYIRLAPLTSDADQRSAPQNDRRRALWGRSLAFMLGVSLAWTVGALAPAWRTGRGQFCLPTSGILPSSDTIYDMVSQAIGKSPAVRVASNDYDGREDYRELFTLPPLRHVLPHATLSLNNRRVSPVDPASVCVISVDDRPLNTNWLPNGQLPYATAAVMSHLSWALRHGYQYRRLPGYGVWAKPHSATWYKVPPLLDTARVCEWTIFCDSDVFFNEPGWSFDDMRVGMGIHDQASIYATNDIAIYRSQNMTNTGFLIVRQTDKSILALEKVISCAEDHPDCDQWRQTWACEQMAFEKFVAHRYLTEGEDLIRGTCDYTNGYWRYEWSPENSCEGKIVSHPWLWKDQVSENVQRLLGLDALRVMLDIFHQGPELRTPFSQNPWLRPTLYLRPADLMAKLLQQADGVAAPGPEVQDVCVLSADGRDVDERFRRTRDAWPQDMDATTATSILQLAYALRQGYNYRRVKLPPFPKHRLNHYWRPMGALADAVETCKWTVFFAQASHPLLLSSSIETLRRAWQVPDSADVVVLEDRNNLGHADTAFMLIRQTPQTIAATRQLDNCDQWPECLALVNVPDWDDRWDWQHLNRAFNQLITPTLPAGTVHVVPACDDTNMTGCNAEIYTPADTRWHDTVPDYLQWSQDISRRAANLLGHEVRRFLLLKWETFPRRLEVQRSPYT